MGWYEHGHRTARGERQTARLRGQKRAKVKRVTAGQPTGEGAESRNTNILAHFK